jgi:hypothetical protein
MMLFNQLLNHDDGLNEEDVYKNHGMHKYKWSDIEDKVAQFVPDAGFKGKAKYLLAVASAPNINTTLPSVDCLSLVFGLCVLRTFCVSPRFPVL